MGDKVVEGVCVRCHTTMLVAAGMEPTALCHSCVYDALDEAGAIARRYRTAHRSCCYLRERQDTRCAVCQDFDALPWARGG